MADGLTPGYLRRRARYWRERAAKATDREKQIRLRQTAEIPGARAVWLLTELHLPNDWRLNIHDF